METPQDPYPTTAQRLVRGFLALVGVCVLYPASIGPVDVLRFSTGFPSEEAWWKIYSPLWFIAGKTSTFGYLNAYDVWWYRTFRPKEGYKFYDSDP